MILQMLPSSVGIFDANISEKKKALVGRIPCQISVVCDKLKAPASLAQVP